MSRLNRFRQRLKPPILRAIMPRQTLGEAILVCGSPRSGTTWAAEVLSQLPRTAILFEPLHLDNVPAAVEAGCSWRTFVELNENWPAGERLLSDALNGRLLNRWTLSQTNFRSAARARSWIVKCVRANRMLPWVTRTFGLRRTLLVVRHPCAVVASQMSQGAWNEPRPPVTQRFLDAYPRFTELLSSLTHPEEMLAAEWAIDNFVPLTAADQAWTTVSYERLVTDPRREFLQLIAQWGLEPPPGFPRDVRAASAMTTGGSRPSQNSHDLHRWKSSLSEEAIDRIGRVVREFGFAPENDTQYFADLIHPTAIHIRESPCG